MSEEGAEVAQALGRQAASLGLPLISGAARGVDQLAMNAAFQAGGTVVGIPARSLVRTLSDGVRTLPTRPAEATGLQGRNVE